MKGLGEKSDEHPRHVVLGRRALCWTGQHMLWRSQMSFERQANGF